MTDRRKTLCQPAFAVRHLSFAICHLPSVICRLSLAICHLPSAIRHLPFAILPSAILHSLTPLLLLADPRDVRLGIEFSPRALVAHEPYSAKDRPLGPWAIVLAADGPGNSGVAVGVATVHLVAIVQIDRDPERRLGVDRPFQDLLGPVHA